ncbi:unnamed protein product [Lactuca saligna]|uniref:Uncharacterized protein n=1 Tax=Lactuca saligna TaxID=75948 RepID=A0AA35YLV2_LACSI|nr:unnamed protein product [Lactuca saligna]
MASTYWALLNNRICARYRGRKNIAKNRFDDFAGNVEAERAQAPTVFHRDKRGEFVDPLVEEQYNALVAEVALQTHHIADFGGDLDTIDWIAIFEKVLDTRRGHVRGIGPKASSAAGTSVSSQWQSQSQASQPTQDVDVNAFLQNSEFVTAIGDIIRSFKNQINEENNDGEDGGEDEDN